MGLTSEAGWEAVDGVGDQERHDVDSVGASLLDVGVVWKLSFCGDLVVEEYRKYTSCRLCPHSFGMNGMKDIAEDGSGSPISRVLGHVFESGGTWVRTGIERREGRYLVGKDSSEDCVVVNPCYMLS